MASCVGLRTRPLESKEEANASSYRARPDLQAKAAVAEASDLETLMMSEPIHQHDGLGMPEEPWLWLRRAAAPRRILVHQRDTGRTALSLGWSLMDLQIDGEQTSLRLNGFAWGVDHAATT